MVRNVEVEATVMATVMVTVMAMVMVTVMAKPIKRNAFGNAKEINNKNDKL